jgi:hypothetical protein
MINGKSSKDPYTYSRTLENEVCAVPSWLSLPGDLVLKLFLFWLSCFEACVLVLDVKDCCGKEDGSLPIADARGLRIVCIADPPVTGLSDSL